MTIPPLTIIPAGAGSGKTHTIQTHLAEWVVAGLVAPDRIVAVTFTEAAASELRERIRSELTCRGRLEDALRLEEAYITTIHGFGLRLLTEFAFDAGMSPHPRLLNEDESDVLIRRALSETDRADAVMDNLSAHGYDYDFASGKGAEELFRDAVLKLIGKLRSIGRLGEDERLIPHAVGLVTNLYGPTADAAVMKRNLRAAVRGLLKTFPHDLSESHGGNATAEKALREDFRHLKLAEEGEPLERDWSLWQKLRKLRTTAMPAEYVALAEQVMAAADELPRHPGPLKDALVHIEALLGAGLDALGRYAAEKRERGLVDYTDMLAVAHTLLTTQPDVLTVLKSRIDCLVIDEFQDTNPLEFALLWELQRKGVPTLIVGDLKQAIMGFQNADPRLMEALQRQYASETRPLDSNWRSTPPLMGVINRIGAGLFGSAYTSLTPKASYPSTTTPLELLNFVKGDTVDDRIRFVVGSIRRLLADETEIIYDKELKRSRRLQAGDVAVLCPTNARLAAYAAVLRESGIRSRIEQEGWYESRIVQLLVSALHHVADPSDRHAALSLCVTELGSHTLESALRSLVGGEMPADTLLDALQPVVAGPADRSVESVLEDIIGRLSLYDVVSSWPDGAQERANMLRLQHESREFMAANREALASGGYYGSGIKTFLAWLAGRAGRENSQPEPRVMDEEAVQLVTWHRSKGREWPVVVVASTDCPVKPRLPDCSVEYENFDDLETVLENALIEVSPDFAAKETSQLFFDRLLPDVLDGAARLLYVALTRAREKLILEWPEFQSKSKAANGSYWSLLRSRTAMSLSGTTLSIMGTEFACLVSTYAGGGTDGSETAYDDSVSPLPDIGRRAIRRGVVPDKLTPEGVSPSSLHDEHAGRVDAVETFRYGEELSLELSVTGAERGTLLHRCFELVSGTAMDTGTLATITGYGFREVEVNAITRAATAFEEWVTGRLKPLRIAREVPVLALDGSGSVVNGSMDLLVESASGFWVIDHKSDQVDDLELRFGGYLPQLACYAEAVTSARGDKPLLGVGVNWISRGAVSMLEVDFSDKKQVGIISVKPSD
jgi:ATP-dependent exoDNAse (exonuclease V) beta subunit